MTNIEHIFRKYDIRGIVGTELSSELMEKIGFAFGRLHPRQVPQIVIGRDNRPSSDYLTEGLIAGLIDAGARVLDLGTVPTPVVYWAEKTMEADAGIQVTGSHNPSEWNGVKMSSLGKPFYGKDIQNLLKILEEKRGEGRVGQRLAVDVIDDYIRDVSGRFSLEKPLKVVLDCGNGVGSLVGVEILETIGADVVPIHCVSDGTFPNHHPDPTVDENLEDLIDTVKSEEADLGIGFACDADRIGAVDGEGNIVRGDLLILLMGLDMLSQKGHGKMIFDVKCSQIVKDEFTKKGGEAIMWKTGHSLIKNKMAEENADLAGEMSGHIFFADGYLGFDDALYSAARLLDVVARADKSFAQIANQYKVYQSTPEIRIEIPETRKKEIMDAAAEHIGRLYKVVDIDGVRILFEGGWGLLRASNTQPVLVARFEAENSDQLNKIRQEIEGWLFNQGVTVE